MFIMNVFNGVLDCSFKKYFLLNSKCYFVFDRAKYVDALVCLVELFVVDFKLFFKLISNSLRLF